MCNSLSHRLAFVLLIAVTMVGALAESLKAPVFRGAMGMGQRASALFELPDAAGSWQGEPGTTVPGTTWRIDRVTLNPSQVTVTVSGRKAVVLTPGNYVLGDRAVTATAIERPPNRPAGELAPVPPPDPATLARRQQAAAALRERHPVAVAASAQPERPPATSAGLVETVDVSKDIPAVASFARKGFSTAVMVTSPVCPVCRKARPAIDSLPTLKARSRVVFADVGVDAKGGINTTAPFLVAHKINYLPYFFLLDEAGEIGAQGEEAQKIISRLVRW